MRFYAASYGPRYGDPICTFVALKLAVAEEAAEKGAEFERNELMMSCEGDCDGRCAFCDPQIVVNTAGWACVPARDLFTATELKEHRHALRQGQAVPLYR